MMIKKWSRKIWLVPIFSKHTFIYWWEKEGIYQLKKLFHVVIGTIWKMTGKVVKEYHGSEGRSLLNWCTRKASLRSFELRTRKWLMTVHSTFNQSNLWSNYYLIIQQKRESCTIPWGHSISYLHIMLICHVKTENKAFFESHLGATVLSSKISTKLGVWVSWIFNCQLLVIWTCVKV